MVNNCGNFRRKLMKTESEVLKMKDDLSKKIQDQQVICNHYGYLTEAWKKQDIEYKKLIAQYNILLEVLR